MPPKVWQVAARRLTAIAAASLVLLLLLCAGPVQQRLSTDTGFDLPHSGPCWNQLNSGSWKGISGTRCLQDSAFAACNASTSRGWRWSGSAAGCGASRRTAAAAEQLLGGRWLVMAGDSVTRNLFAALLRLISGTEHEVVYGHRDFEYMLPSQIRASFLWAPYLANITEHMQRWTVNGEGPNMVIVSAGLWHMLHVPDPQDFVEQEAAFSRGAALFAAQEQGARLAMVTISHLHPAKLKTVEKRAWMTPARVDAWNRALQASSFLETGTLLDLHHLTKGCGAICTHDGLHYSNATYDAALQIFLNQLFIS